MPTGLNVSRVVNVSVTIAPRAAAARNFGAMLLLGSSNIIDTQERIREFDGLDAVAATFGVNAAEYQAATLFFGQSPQPQMCYIGRWAQNPTPGILHGAIQTPYQQLITNFQSVTQGAFFVAVDGVPYALTGLNLSTATNLNGVASIVQAALVTAGATGARCLWGSINQRFDVISGTTGALSSVSYAQAPTATTSVTFSGQPAVNSTLTLNGNALTFVSGTPTGNQVAIGAATAVTLQNLAQAINTSTDPQISLFTAYASGTKLYLWSDAPGASGNALTVVAGGTSNGAVLISPMTGGSGTDISVLLGLSVIKNQTGANANPPVAGVAAESLTQAVSTLANQSTAWYGLTVATAVPPSDQDHQNVAAFIEASTVSRIYAITTQNTAVIDSTRTDDIASVIMSLGYNRTMVQYSTSGAYNAINQYYIGSPFAVCSILGRLATINWEGINTALTLKFKQEPGVISEFLYSNQADALEAKNANVFVQYANSTSILEQGVMSGGYYIDERVGLDWLQNAVQTDLYNILYQSPTKIPQTDEGQNLLIAQCYATTQRAKNNGLVAPGIWTGPSFGTLKTNDKMQTGVYFYSDSYDLQPASNRAQRQAMPIQGAIKMAGAVHSISVAIVATR